MICLLNGNKLEVFQDDNYHNPNNITRVLETANLLELHVQTDTEIIISINEYNYIGIGSICEKNIDLTKEKHMLHMMDACINPFFQILIFFLFQQQLVR